MGRFLTKSLAVSAAALVAVAPAYAAGDAGAGAAVFKSQCAICHSMTANGVGPKLHGVVGRKAGSAAGFNYSPAMKNSGVVWNTADLHAYITNPAAKIKGNRMPFAGLHNAKQVDVLVAYLATQH